MSFASDMANARANIERDAKNKLYAVAYQTLSGVVMKSPVDTGRFRGNWQADVNYEPINTVESTDKGGGSTIRSQSSSLGSAEIGDTIYITNNLPYAQKLEYGYSGQAPQGMIRITIADIEQQIKIKGWG